MAYDPARAQVVLFGGAGSSGNLADTWVWDGNNWTQKNPTNSPPAQYGHAMATDSTHMNVVLNGQGETLVWDTRRP